jgi:hypothetical protein
VQQKNALEDVRDQLVGAMGQMSEGTRKWAESMAPYNAEKVSPETEAYFFHNMADYYRGEGLDNAQAWQRFLSEENPAEVLAMVQRVYELEKGSVGR